MNYTERYYRKVMGSIGLSMLLFLVLINLVGFASFFMDRILSEQAVLEPYASIVYSISYGFGYLLSFMLPVALLKGLLKKSPYTYQQMQTALCVSPWAFLFIPVIVILAISASYVNVGFVRIYQVSSLTDAFVSESLSSTTPIDLVLQFFVMCAVPGFCEEFLFRGAILSNCLPFGKANAVMISAFLFAMMHQNPEQIFYTFVAGILLALLYIKTKSIWPGTIVHILNNFISLLQYSVFEKNTDPLFGSAWMIAIELILFLLGILALFLLISRFGTKKIDFSEGIYQKDISASDGYVTAALSPKRAFRLFLTPSMIVFLSLCVLQIFVLILMAVFNGLFV